MSLRILFAKSPASIAAQAVMLEIAKKKAEDVITNCSETKSDNKSLATLIENLKNYLSVRKEQDKNYTEIRKRADHIEDILDAIRAKESFAHLLDEAVIKSFQSRSTKPQKLYHLLREFRGNPSDQKINAEEKMVALAKVKAEATIATCQKLLGEIKDSDNQLILITALKSYLEKRKDEDKNYGEIRKRTNHINDMLNSIQNQTPLTHFLEESIITSFRTTGSIGAQEFYVILRNYRDTIQKPLELTVKNTPKR